MGLIRLYEVKSRKMDRLFNCFLLMITCFLLLHCRSTKSNSEDHKVLHVQATRYLGTGFRNIENDAGNLVLFYSIDKKVGNKNLRFVILEKDTGEALTSVISIKGKVRWYDDQNLYVEEERSFVKDDRTPLIEAYILDVYTGRKKQANL